MEPEIARRCKICGAAIRARATFCPQCGVPLPNENAPSKPVGTSTDAPENLPSRVSDGQANAQTIDPAAQMKESAKSSAPVTGDTHYNKDAAVPSVPVENPLPPPTAAQPIGTLADGAAAKRQRVATAAPEVMGESSRPRAEKLRRASNVMLDEAAADPSLRFVLVAAVLLILSLLLLVLGRIL